MALPLRTERAPMPFSPTTESRWWESARQGRLFCGPDGDGHHLPARFQIPEFGFVQCTAPALPSPLLELKRYRESRNFPQADRLERELRCRGVDVPDTQRLKLMAKDAPMCARWVFIYTIRGGLQLTVRVDEEDKHAMEHLSTPAAMLEYLQVLPVR